METGAPFNSAERTVNQAGLVKKTWHDSKWKSSTEAENELN